MIRGIFVLAVAFLGAGCSSLDRDREGAVRAVESLVRERTGYEPVASVPGDGSLSASAKELLERPLTEESAVRIAFLNNRKVSAAFARLGVGSAELHQAGRLPNPLLTADAKFFGGGTEIELGITESLLDVFFVAARKRVAQADFEATKLRIAGELVRLVHEVRRAVVSVRAAERLLQVEREILRAAEASVELMTELHRAGNVTDPDLTSEELALARARLSVARAEAALLEAREPMNGLLGLWGDSVAWTTEGTLADDADAALDLEQVETRAIQSSLALAGVRAEATAQARRLGVVGWEATVDPAEAGIVAKKEARDSEWGVGPSIGFSLPVFDAGSARRAAVASRLESALAEHVSSAVEIRSVARRLRARVTALSDQVRFLRGEELPRSKRLVRETLRNYNAMQVGAFDVLVARTQEIEAMRDYVETLRAAWMARIDLEELLAGNFNQARVEAVPEISRDSMDTSHRNGEH
jgi:outer membrane protein, heavy metal efflux system